jgi:predicted outer membrane repeat protein
MILEDVNFYNNHSVIAGALYSDRSSLELRNSEYAGNTSLAGGGALVCHNAGLYGFSNCLFEDNRAGGSGGAVALLEAIIGRFKNCTIRNNSAKSDVFYASGGGVLVTPYDNVVSFVNCRIENNSAGDFGGGVYAGTKTDFISSLLINNRASTDTIFESGGGAIYMYTSENTILNCTFANNEGNIGTTILSEDAHIGFVNTILWDDEVGTDAKIYLSSIEETPSINVSSSNINGGQGVIRGSLEFEVHWGKGNIEADPLFEMPGIDFRLSDESPCIDTGRLDTLQFVIPFTDLDGNDRIYRDSIDMGCFENQTAFGIPENISNPGLFVYPNPARGHIYLKNRSGADVDGVVQISDSYGRILQDEEIHLDQNTIRSLNVVGLKNGIYFLRVVEERETSTFRFLIAE